MKPKASSQRLPDYPLNVIFDRSVSQPAVDWPTPGLVHNTSSLIALVSLQGASAYTTSGRWPPGLRFDSGWCLQISSIEFTMELFLCNLIYMNPAASLPMPNIFGTNCGFGFLPQVYSGGYDENIVRNG